MKKINLAEKLATFGECYKPRTVTEFNGHDLLRDGSVELNPGDLFVVPRGAAAPRTLI